MKASVYTQYGSPDVLHIAEIARPAPKDNEILVKVHASTVTPTDCAMLKADPFIIRFINGLRRPKVKVLGGQFGGQVEAVGKAVTRFKPGDAVYGLTTTDFGMHAEYARVPDTDSIRLLPAALSYEDGACVAETLTPLYFMRDMANLQPGQRILINGAAGAVGSYGVQVAKILGAHVTAVCSTANVELVRSLGADVVIDRTKTDFTRTGETYDVIFDAVGKSSFARCKRALTRDGIYLTTVPSFGILFQWLRTARSRKRARIGFAGLNVTKDNLTYLHDLLTAGTLRTVIDRCYPLEQIADAYRYVDAGHKTGNVVVTMGR